MTVCMYRDIRTTTLYYWRHTTGMPHLKNESRIRFSSEISHIFFFLSLVALYQCDWCIRDFQIFDYRVVGREELTWGWRKL